VFSGILKYFQTGKRRNPVLPLEKWESCTNIFEAFQNIGIFVEKWGKVIHIKNR
jgi:hypothetical protein